MGDGVLARLKERFESTFHPFHTISAACKSPTLEQMKDVLEHASSITERAKRVTGFAAKANVLGEAAEKLDKAAEQLNSLVEKGDKVAGDMTAACQIVEAVEVLNQWTLDSASVSNQEAAKAFDKLFGGAARFFKKLPWPASAYADIFAEIAKDNFFSRMQDLMDPESPNTPRGRAMREALGNN